MSVFSRSSLAPVIAFLPRARPIASISSIKIIDGDFSLACLKRSRTREAPTPTNISTKSEPDREKKGTCASPATALARSVLPVPGGPTSRAPRGILPPNEVYLSGFLRKSTISCTSSLAPSKPATSWKVTRVSFFSSNIRALDFPILNMPPGPPAPAIRRITNIHKPMTTIIGKRVNSKSPITFCWVLFSRVVLRLLSFTIWSKRFSKLLKSPNSKRY